MVRRLFMYLFGKKMSQALGGKMPSKGTLVCVTCIMPKWHFFVYSSADIVHEMSDDHDSRALFPSAPPSVPALVPSSHTLSSALGKRLGRLGTSLWRCMQWDWEGFVDISREIMKGRNSKQQQETVAGVLTSIMPPGAPEQFRLATRR